ncbi:MAG: SPOR domain-containing protein, partial [Pseudolabrys sp.]
APGAGATAMPADQTGAADMTPAAAPQPAQPLAPAAPASRQPAPAPRRAVTHRATPQPTHRVASAPPSNAPLSLNPNAPLPAPAATRVARAPTSLAPAGSPRPVTSASGGYAVQVSSRHNRADAQAALSRVQNRYASVVGGQQVMIRRVDLAGKGVYYRAMIGPFGSSAEASRLCSQLKAAGGSCFVQKI